MGSSAWETKASVIIALVLGTSCRKPLWAWVEIKDLGDHRFKSSINMY